MTDIVVIEEQGTTVVEVTSPGPQGASGVMRVGSVTTGPAGSQANVTNSGTTTDAVFNFTIPRGDVGDVTPEATAAKNTAEAAAAAALASQNAASGSASAAATSQSNAAGSATAASASAATATTKASEASTSAAAAAASQSSATSSATLATNKAAEAASSATAAATSSSDATQSANAAVGFANAASASSSAASASATSSAGSASKAQEWATKTSGEVETGQGFGAKKYAQDASALANSAEIAAAGSLAHSQTSALHALEASNSADNANASAVAATISSNSAASSASAATSQAATATTQAANASASAATATTQASSATTSAITASTQAGIATTKASEASTSASAASVSAAAALASQTASAGSAAAANTSAGSAAGSAANALAIYGTTNAQQAALMAAQSAASLAQGFALSASSAIQQDLSGVTAQALHRSPNAVTAMFVYDTSKDSDGGAWTEKCQHTSWYNEALNGKWLGAWDNEFQARHAGATVSSTEVLTNGTFDSNITGWTAGAGSAAWAAGAAQITGSSGVIARLFQAMTLTAGKTYRLTATCVSTTDTSTTLEFLGGSVSTTFNAGQTKSLYFSAASTGTFYAQVRNTNAGAVVSAFDNISVREVTALTTASGDYYQSTVDGKFYRLWKNLLSYSNNFENAVWTKGVSTVSPDAIAGPDGSVTADAIVESTTSGNQGLLRTLQDYGRKTFAFDVKAGGRQYFTMGWFAGDNSYLARLTVDLANGSVTQWAAPTGGGNDYTYTVTPKGNGWYRIAGSYTRGAGGFPSRVWFGPSDTSTASGESKNYLGDGRTAIYLSNFQVEEGSTATAYEARGADGSVTETFRGNKADFPRLAGIVAEATNVTIYDLTEAGRPMWMRFVGTTANGGMLGGYGFAITVSSLACLNATLSVPMSEAYNGAAFIDFAKDSAKRINDATYLLQPLLCRRGIYPSGIANRNNTAFAFDSSIAVGLASSVIRAVAMTVLPDAPVDAVTGLQVPTIAVATAGGVSVIQNNGVVLTGTAPGGPSTTSIDITEDLLTISSGNTASWYYISKPGKLTANFTFNRLDPSNSFPWFNTGGSANARRWKNAAAKFDASRVGLLRHNAATVGKGVGTVVSNTYNTGHLIGDIRRAYLADVDVGSVSGPELVTNGDFSNETTGWTADANAGGLPAATLSTVGGRLRVACGTGGGRIGFATQSFATVIGKTYQYRATGYTGTAGFSLRAGSTARGFDYVDASPATGVPYSAIFTATTTTTYLTLVEGSTVEGQYAEFDNISVQGVVADRSYKAQAASITGTLTKTQVAAASQLVAYSGFSAANYLREPYSADLDFGTGEWSASAWVNYSPTSPVGKAGVGPNLQTNGDFSNGLTGWSNYSGSLYFGTVEVVGGRLHLVSTGTNRGLFGNGGQSPWQLVVGKAYKVTLDIEFPTGNGSALTIQINQSFANSAMGPGYSPGDPAGFARQNITGVQTLTAYFIATSTTGGINFDVPSGFVVDLYVDNVVVQEVPTPVIASRRHSSGAYIELCASHATSQVSVAGGYLMATVFDGTTTRTVTTTAAYNTATWIKPEAVYTTDGTLAIRVNGAEVAATRGNPLLSLNSRYNLLTNTEDFANAAWTKTGVTVTANAGISPDGTITSDALLCSGNSNHQFIGALATSGSSVISIYVKQSVSPCFYIGSFSHGGTVYFDLVNKTVSSLVSPAINASIADSDNGFVICKVTLSAVSNYLHLGFLDAVYTGTSTSPWAITTQATEGFIWGASAVPVALAALPYQRVGASLAETQVAPLTIGNSYAGDAPFPGSISLLKLSATVPTAEQSQWMYEQEKQMFRDGAQVTLPDAGAIVDLTYDDATDKWIAVSATNESEWSGLVRTSVTPSPAGSYTKVSAASGVQLQARSTTNPGVDITIPSYGLREELVRRSESAARLARTITVLDYAGGFTANTTVDTASVTGVAGLLYPASYIGARVTGANIQADTFVVGIVGTTMYLTKTATSTVANAQLSFSDFVLPLGYEAKAVLVAGAAKQEGATKDFTRLFDGFKETIRFGTSPAYNAFVQIQATRTVA